MTTRKITWNVTCNRCVAFLDIMGFKDLVFRNKHSDILTKLMSFQPSVNAINRLADKTLSETSKEEWDSSLSRVITFSDSIILVTNDDSVYAAQSIFTASRWIMAKAISNGIPIKGAIAYGEQTDDFKDNVHFGKPIIDAYELQDELHFYGIVLHHTMEKYLADKKTLGIAKKLGNIFNWKTPFKSGKVAHYVVNWPSILECFLQVGIPHFCKTFSPAPVGKIKLT